MRNIELKIDGEVIVLTSQQTEQLARAIKKETSVPAPKLYGSFTFCCKEAGKKTAYPFVLKSSAQAPSSCNVGSVGTGYGRDFSLLELKGFIKELKLYAAQIWTTAEKELKSV